MNKIKVFFDNNCGLCSKEINHYKQISPPNTFEWIDILTEQDTLAKHNLDVTTALKEIHVLDKDNNFQLGVDAFITIWQEMNNWKHLAIIIRLPLIYQFTKLLYSIFAKWRFNRLGYCKTLILLITLSLLTHNAIARDKFDINRYMGTWYEQARYTNFFQKACQHSQAKYTLQANNKVQVINSCTTHNNQLKTAKGIARIPNKNKPKELKVSFVPIPLLKRLLEGDYHIIYLDNDYNYVIIGEPKKKYLWIMSRDEQISQSKLTELINTATELGYQERLIKITGLIN